MKWLAWVLLVIQVQAQDVFYKSGENSGQGKVERLDRSEKYLEEVSKKMTSLETEVKVLREEVKELKLRLNSMPGMQLIKPVTEPETESSP